jgi:hypothetical protein
MATPQAPGTTIGETATAGDYTWTWNGYGWDLVPAAAGNWFNTVVYSSQMVAHSYAPPFIDYL